MEDALATVECRCGFIIDTALDEPGALEDIRQRHRCAEATFTYQAVDYATHEFNARKRRPPK